MTERTVGPMDGPKLRENLGAINALFGRTFSRLDEVLEALRSCVEQRNAADASLAAYREALGEAKKLIRGWHGISNVSHPHEDRLWAIYDANAPEMKPINALLASPDPARGIVERLKAGERLADLIRVTTNYPVEFYEALAAYDKAVGPHA